jgi:hypothetical protein
VLSRADLTSDAFVVNAAPKVGAVVGVGDRDRLTATDGSNNTAQVFANCACLQSSSAFAGGNGTVSGSGDTATATGPDSNATAGPGDGYTATAGPNQTVTNP